MFGHHHNTLVMILVNYYCIRPLILSYSAEVKDDIPLTLRIRAAIGTALGATAARAKLLADQEDREIEHLVATIIEAQVEKLQQKVKHFDELELLMEKEHAEMEELKDSILTERIDVLRKTFKSGVARWKHYPSLKS